MAWQRARRPEQKQMRRQAILEATAALLEEHPPDDVSLNGIARHTGLAKSNLYRYFNSREEIFLTLLTADLTEWVNALEAELREIEPSTDPAAVAATLAKAAIARPRMLALMSQLSGVLEHNLGEETVVSFKRDTMALGLQLGSELQRALPDLDFMGAMTFIRLVYANVAGLYPMSRPAPVLEKVMESPEFAPLKIHFEPELERAFRLLLHGLLVESGGRPPTR